MKHAHDVFGEMVVAEALDEFLLWTDENVDEEILTHHEQFFYPWFLFNWVYDSNETETALDGPENITVAEQYQAHRGKRLDPLERRLIETTAGQPFSFYEVQDCQPGRGYRLKDIFRGASVDVLEKMGSQNARRGDILLARVVQIDAIAMAIGSGAVLIPPRMKPELIRFREWLLEANDPITSVTLYEYDFEIREFYFDIYNALMRPPDWQNTDGDPDELINIPEVREHMEKVLFEHWNGWVDDKIPALGGKTPRQAVKNPDGRESVEALLMDAERHLAKNKQMRDIGPTAIEDVRRRLGLDEPLATKAEKTAEKKKTEKVDAIGKMIEAFGHDKLNSTYTDLALKLCFRIARMRKLSIQRGRNEIWAAAILYVIARLNFLFDPENEINITADELCAFFGTKKTTVSSKAGLIQKACDLYVGDTEFSSPEIANMFRIYETEEGLLIPGSMIHENGEEEQPGNTSKAARFGDKDSGEKRRSRKHREKIQPGTEAKPKKDDRQLKLFNDD
jgi:hypothetical protein